MNECALAVLLVIGVWWLSTGIVLRVVWLPTRTHRTSLAVFTALALLGGYATLRASELPTTAGAYVGFVAALALWGWHEVAFLLGAVSGPRREPCRAGLSGWARFREATATVIHHELALAATLLAMVAGGGGGRRGAPPPGPPRGCSRCCGRCGSRRSSTSSPGSATSPRTSCRRTCGT
jgi:putative photosynthetic complex assembly protein 2